jgi:hypothetical protein
MSRWEYLPPAPRVGSASALRSQSDEQARQVSCTPGCGNSNVLGATGIGQSAVCDERDAAQVDLQRAIAVHARGVYAARLRRAGV